MRSRTPLAFVVVALVACEPAPEAPPPGTQPATESPAAEVDAAAEEQRIQELNQQWVQAVQAGDVETIQELYASDGMIGPPNMPQAEGRAAVGETWQALLQTPGLQLDFGSSRIEVARAGDMAYDIGTYTMSLDGPEGTVRDEGKYLVVWVKEEGDWRVAADIFNSDMPAADQQ